MRDERFGSTLRRLFSVTVVLGIILASAPAPAQEQGDLAKKTQNPVSDLVSVPFQNNVGFGVGPDDDYQWILNIQPVIPIKKGKINLINRSIVPLIRQPVLFPGGDSEVGLGDISHTLFFSPAEPGEVIWGVGPVVSLPTATDEVLGFEKWGLGPSVVVLTMPGHWVVGGLAQNIFTVADDDSSRQDLNQFLFQPFLNRNYKQGWYATSSPIITADWEASSSNRWTIPVGGGFGKISKIGKRPVNAQFQAFYNLEHPDGAAEWSIRFQIALLYPKKPKAQ